MIYDAINAHHYFQDHLTDQNKTLNENNVIIKFFFLSPVVASFRGSVSLSI